MNYSKSTIYKTTLAKGGYSSGLLPNVSLWRNTNAITSITLFGESSSNFKSGTTFNLYGIASGAGPLLVGGGGGGASATGGTGSSNTGGSGGNGTASSITGSSVTYAGGGGGGAHSSGTTQASG